MGRLLAGPRIREILLSGGVFSVALGLILWPAEAARAVRQGFLLCGNVLIPALFPFFLLSSLVIELGLTRTLERLLSPIMYPLFRVNGSCGAALALGVVGGYPVGARTAIQLYRSGQCSKAEAERLLAFCNNCGPAFILGVVGAGLFHSGRAGLLLYAAHLLASLLVGLLFRFYHAKEEERAGTVPPPRFQAASFSAAFTKSVGSALSGCLNISAFVMTFSVLLAILSRSGLMGICSDLLGRLLSPLGFDRVWAGQLLTGLLELSSGVTGLPAGPTGRRLSAAAFLLGWAGLSVHCQVLAFLGDSGLSLRPYLIGKLLHGFLSSGLVLLLVQIFQLEEDTSCLFQSDITQEMEFSSTFAHSAAAAWAFWVFTMILSSFIAKYAVEKRGRL